MIGSPEKQRGMTLIEVVISIVIIAIAVSGVLGVLATNVQHSADAMVVNQGISIASAYLEEISLKAFADPDGIDGEIGRGNFDDIDDYDGLFDNGAVDQFGNPIPSLTDYSISVAVNTSSALPGIAPSDVYRIDVRVEFAPYVDYTLSGYRTRL
jgi:MSHA pilin protein MshD